MLVLAVLSAFLKLLFSWFSRNTSIEMPLFPIQGSLLFVTYTIIQGIIRSEMYDSTLFPKSIYVNNN